MHLGSTVLLRNSKPDTRKRDKMQPKWIGPYIIVASLGKSLYRIKNKSLNLVLKNAVHSVRLKKYFRPDHTSVLEATNRDVIEQPFAEAKYTPSDQVEEMVCHTKPALTALKLDIVKLLLLCRRKMILIQ